MLYEIHTKNKMFTQIAVYFKTVETGVMFFDTEDRGIAFVPNINLLFIRENQKAKEAQKEELCNAIFGSGHAGKSF